jgi:hypothetical protein
VNFTASTAGTVLTVTTSPSPTGVPLQPGTPIFGTGVAANTVITSWNAVLNDGTGSYNINIAQNLGSRAMTGIYTLFQEVSFEQAPLGPGAINGDWTIANPGVGVTKNTQFTGESSGWYLMTYKIDLRTNSPNNYLYTRAASALVQSPSNSGPWQQITGSGSAAQAPDTNHQYSISNTVLVFYTKGDLLALQWWAGYYNASSILQLPTTGLTLGPYSVYDPYPPTTPATEIPWIPGNFSPGPAQNIYAEATASLVITRIVDELTFLF